MTDQQKFEQFKTLCLDILAQSGNCEDSRKLFAEATSIPMLVAAWRKFLDGLVHEVPRQVVAAFAEYYEDFKQDINLAGLFYNEQPTGFTFPCTVFVGDDDGKPMVDVNGQHRVYVLGNKFTVVRGSCRVYIGCEQAQVAIFDNCIATMDCGICECFGHSQVIGSGDIRCHDATTVSISGGTLQDYGHIFINAFNNAVVDSFTNKKIHLHDNAKLNMRLNLT